MPSDSGQAASLLSRIDHLVYATPDLKAGIEQMEGLLGVQASHGGQHPGLGTRNALIALGTTCYLEIVGPDPEQKTFQTPRLFGIDDLTAGKLATWAANCRNLEGLAELKLGKDLRIGAVHSGSRETPEGILLSWRFTDPRTVVAGGIVPFFIDWGKTMHPAHTAAKGATLIELRAEHPEPEQVRETLSRLGIALEVSSGPKAALIAVISSTRGRVELQ